MKRAEYLSIGRHGTKAWVFANIAGRIHVGKQAARCEGPARCGPTSAGGNWMVIWDAYNNPSPQRSRVQYLQL